MDSYVLWLVFYFWPLRGAAGGPENILGYCTIREKQPSVRREEVNDGGGFEESRANRRIALEMDYNKHPRFVAIRRPAEEI